MCKTKYFRLLLLISCIISIVFVSSQLMYGQNYKKLLKSTANNLSWRSIGPAVDGGRVDDLAVVENNPHVIYCGTASGGLWKTTNNMVTWEPIFDKQSTSSIGDVTVAPSNPEIVWVGTGEANSRNSSSWGNGVFKSQDGGKTWLHMGLEETHHIGRVIIEQFDPNIVYVAAAGKLWGPNRERGLFKTTDGGETWTNILFVDVDTGCIDVAIDPSSNNILYAAMYQRRRRGWGFIGGGPGSGLYKTINAGKTWTKLTKDLPEGDTGRIGIAIYRRDPNVVYALVENKNGGVFRSEDKGDTWVKMSSTNPRPMYYSQIRIDPNNDQRIWVLGYDMNVSFDGGRTFKTDVVTRIHCDFHALWINPANSNHMITGSDGGVHTSYDRGKNWETIDNLPIGQFYEIGYDLRKPYYIYGGLQDNWSWKGPSATRHAVWELPERGIMNADWIRVGGGDGFYNQVDPKNQNILYVESQNGNLRRKNLFTDESKSIKPEPEDDTETYRFNWNSPVLISPHNSKTIYLGGNKLFKSIDQGDTWTASSDLSSQLDKDKLQIMGMLVDENTLSKNDGIYSYGTITAVAESPVKAGILWVGTDDGKVQVSKDGGKEWTNLIGKIKGVPKLTYVSRIVASHFVESRAYITFDGHRNSDFKAYVYVTENLGKTWKSIANNLPQGGTVNVIREHPRNQKLLFVGTERGAYFSIDRGENWIKFEGNFPIVPVDDIAIHPRENDLIFGTHGRSIYVLDDITCLEQLNKGILDSEIYLFKIRPAERFQIYNHRGFSDHREFTAPNPLFGAIITYYLKSKLDKEEKVVITILDNKGNKINKIEGTKQPGFNRVNWDLRYERISSDEEDSYYAPASPFVVPGEYTVKLTVQGKSMEVQVVVEMDPRIKVSNTDLIAQKDAALRLSELYSKGTKINQQNQNLQDQIKNLKGFLKKLKNLDGSILKDINSFEEKLKKIQIKLMGTKGSWGRTVMRDISGLLRNINGYSSAPTDYQMGKIEKLSGKLEKNLTEMAGLLNTELPKLNKKIEGLNIPFLNPRKY
ncbi:hypothetical protein LCGC14_0822560 [marine sediment metagenome]|uniref:Sortilin N-terminal domain-containing protein n=1 Tax=marine sediment metagenome TaxID=412755 RepID=A0A0F9PN09_9ZZZZ